MAYFDVIKNEYINLPALTDAEFKQAQSFLFDILRSKKARINTCRDNARLVMPLSMALHGNFGWNLKDDSLDAFFTPNSLSDDAKVRNKSNIQNLNCLYMDLDLKDRFEDPEQAVEEINSYLREKNLEPSYYISSGSQSGLHLYWILPAAIEATEKNISLWKKLQEAIYELLKNYNADKCIVTDYARVLRVPGSINSKYNTRVYIVKKSNKKYNISYLKENLLGILPASKKEASEAQLLLIKRMEETLNTEFKASYKANAANAQKTIALNMQKYLDAQQKSSDAPISDAQLQYIEKICRGLNIDYKIVKDLIKTVKQAQNWIKNHKSAYAVYVAKQKESNKIIPIWKGSQFKATREYWELKYSKGIEKFVKDNPNNSHKREVLLFIYRLSCCHLTHDTEKALEMMLELNQKYDEPFDELLIERLTHSAEKYYKNDPEKFYNAENIEDMITSAEFPEVHIIQYFKAPKRDRSEYQHAYYQNKLKTAGRTSCQEKKEERYLFIEKLKTENPDMKKSEIVKIVGGQFGLALATVRRDFNFVLEKTNNFSTSYLLNKGASGSVLSVHATDALQSQQQANPTEFPAFDDRFWILRNACANKQLDPAIIDMMEQAFKAITRVRKYQFFKIDGVEVALREIRKDFRSCTYHELIDICQKIQHFQKLEKIEKPFFYVLKCVYNKKHRASLDASLSYETKHQVFDVNKYIEPAKINSFNQFPQRSYDYDSLEAELFANASDLKKSEAKTERYDYEALEKELFAN